VARLPRSPYEGNLRRFAGARPRLSEAKPGREPAAEIPSDRGPQQAAFACWGGGARNRSSEPRASSYHGDKEARRKAW